MVPLLSKACKTIFYWDDQDDDDHHRHDDVGDDLEGERDDLVMNYVDANGNDDNGDGVDGNESYDD